MLIALKELYARGINNLLNGIMPSKMKGAYTFIEFIIKSIILQ